MRPLFILLLALTAARNGFSQMLPADTLKAGVADWNKLPVRHTEYGEDRQVLKGATHDLSNLDIQACTIFPGRDLSPAPAEFADRLLIVREGSITVQAGSSHKVLGPGGIGLFAAGNVPVLSNTGTANAVCYIFSFRSRSSPSQDRVAQAGPPLLLDWPELTVKKTDKGESRAIFSRPVAWLSKIDMHATTLNPGEISHPQHVHRNEEIILLRSGHVRMHIADSYQKAAGGDLVFLASGVPHNLENGKTGETEYFALQWEP
jgi:(S)-ureidoglycine aminohydrolase